MKSIPTILILVLLITFTSSSMAQTGWEKYEGNPVLSPGPAGVWDDVLISFPSVLFDGSTYHMWYGNYNDNPLCIGYATSLDGITWTKYDDPATTNPSYAESDPVLIPGPPGSYDDEGVSHPNVIRIDDTYHMWYAGGGDPSSPGHSEICHAVSPDGIIWAKDTLNPVLKLGTNGTWDDYWLVEPCVVFDDNLYHMWYCAWNGIDEQVRIGHATAPHPDSAWTKDPNNPVLTRGSSNSWDYPRVDAPSVFFDGSKFHMYYSGGTYPNWCIGYAWSQDGSQWQKYVDNPVLDWGESGEFDDKNVSHCSVILDTVNQRMKMWYIGGRTLTNGHIGYATAPSIMGVPDEYETIQAAIDSGADGNLVLVEEGTYYENINFKGKAITVASYFYMDGDTSHISKTIIDGSQPSHADSGSVVTFGSGEDTTSVLMGFTITGGTGTRDIDLWGVVFRQGGGIDILYSGAKIVSNKIIDNHIPDNIIYQGFGAGINAYGENDEYVIISDNKIVNNSITSTSHTGGAGVSLGTAGTIHFLRNLVEGNSNTATGTRVALGGGVYVWGGSFEGRSFNGDITISGNIIKENTVNPGAGTFVPQGGGGLYIDLCSPQVENNIIVDNHASNGAGVLVCGKHRGGLTGIAFPIIVNNTIANNMATQNGGGLYSMGDPTNAIHPKIVNTIFWGDTAPIGSEIYNIGPLSVAYSDIQGGWDGEGNIDADPQFIDTLLYNLSELSPCVGTGIDSIQIAGTWYYCPVTDILGRKRPYPVDSFVDMGARESQFSFPDGINESYTLSPFKFRLIQNYPNPFNPTTVISWQLAVGSHVELSIYNILGQKIETLLNKPMPAGYHEVEFNGQNLSSGIYMYRIEAGEWQDVKKMVLVK